MTTFRQRILSQVTCIIIIQLIKSQIICVEISAGKYCESIDYHEKRFVTNINLALNHLVREIGEIALAIEKAKSEHAKLKLTEAWHYCKTLY